MGLAAASLSGGFEDPCPKSRTWAPDFVGASARVDKFPRIYGEIAVDWTQLDHGPTSNEAPKE
jgi:hypothetical protein